MADTHKYGYSYPDGKEDVRYFLWRELPTNAKILDVGAGGGTYYHLLGPDFDWSAIEIWHDTVEYIKQFYSKVYENDIRNFQYVEDYDLIIFGDIIEHLPIPDAQRVLDIAKKHTKAILVAVPYNLEQEPIYGNEAERHLQPDLTDEIFHQRYPGFDRIVYTQKYGYYYWRKEYEQHNYWFVCNA